MEFLSSNTRLHIEVSCQDAGHDWESAVADDLVANGFQIEEEGNIYEVDSLPEVLTKVDAFLNFREEDFYSPDLLIDGRLKVNCRHREGDKKSKDPGRFQFGHYMEVYRWDELCLNWQGADDYTREWIDFAAAYLNGNAPTEYPELSPEATADEEEVLEELLRLFTLPTLDLIED